MQVHNIVSPLKVVGGMRERILPPRVSGLRGYSPFTSVFQLQLQQQ